MFSPILAAYNLIIATASLLLANELTTGCLKKRLKFIRQVTVVLSNLLFGASSCLLA